MTGLVWQENNVLFKLHCELKNSIINLVSPLFEGMVFCVLTYYELKAYLNHTSSASLSLQCKFVLREKSKIYRKNFELLKF